MISGTLIVRLIFKHNFCHNLLICYAVQLILTQVLYLGKNDNSLEEFKSKSSKKTSFLDNSEPQSLENTES